MNGTTRCPHCETRFKIAEAQLGAHHGMVRCGNCLQAFDARPHYLAEQASPQLDLPIDGEISTHTDTALNAEPDEHPPHTVQVTEPEESLAVDPVDVTTANHPEIEQHDVNVSDTSPVEPQHTDLPTPETITPPDDTLDFSQIAASQTVIEEHRSFERPITDEMPAHTSSHLEHGEHNEESLPAKVTRVWPWMTGVAVLCLLLLFQATYFYRISLAAKLPALKPALLGFCQLLDCSVPLPQQPELLSIESSSLDANSAQASQITLNALLRNRASYTIAFPALSLTLNDSQDQPLARRLFSPGEYLPSDESEIKGMGANHEISVKLPLNTNNLKASGYRLELFYSKK